MKSNKILKSLAGLTACLSALGAHGSAFASERKSPQVLNANTSLSAPNEKITNEKIVNTLKKEPPQNRISRTLLSKFEKNIGSSYLDENKRTGEVTGIVVPTSGTLEPAIISKKEIKNESDLAKTVCQKVLRKELEAYMDELGSKTLKEATDNDFSDWKFLQPKQAESAMRAEYDYTKEKRRKMGNRLAGMEKNLPNDELGVFVDQIIKENDLLDVEFPNFFSKLLDENDQESNRFSKKVKSRRSYNRNIGRIL